jgi:hypothetical protein
MIVTFGFGHSCSCGLSLRSCYVEMESRRHVVQHYGRKWAFEYASEDEAGVARYDLQRIEPDATCECGGRGREPFEPAHAG